MNKQSFDVKIGLAEMLKGGVIMDVNDEDVDTDELLAAE